jgi:hypothetical protein
MTPDEDKFRSLAYQVQSWRWKAGRPRYGELTASCSCLPYQRIIGMGERAIPYILEELERAPDYWFWALYCITGEDPVPEADHGNLDAMTRAWVAWGRENGYLSAGEGVKP